MRFRSDDLKKISIVPDADWLHKWDYSVQPRRDLGRFDISDYVDLFYTDDNAFYLVGAPELGNVKIHNFYGQHAEGGSIRTLGKYTHAEGRDNIADIRYAHVEGTHCAACDMASHAEGFWTKAGGRFSHTEGR